MSLQTLNQAHHIRGKKVLVRVDFNIETDTSGASGEHFKLEAAKETIDFLFAQGAAKVVLLSHLGRPNGKVCPEYSLRSLIDDVERALQRNVVFVADCVGELVESALQSVKDTEVILLENVRFYEQEEMDDAAFAQQLARPFDMFVNDAFSVCHRAHASVSAITRVLESYAGFRLLKEIQQLERLQVQPEHPAVAVIGGAKIETKLPVIRKFEALYDAVLIGGKIANEALDQQMLFSEKVILPIDFRGDDRYDIGDKTIQRFVSLLQSAKTIVWNGPMGKFEESPYDIGTKAIVHALADNKDATVIIGGGESLTVAQQAGLLETIGFVSTGGGAMLDFLGGNPLPGLTALGYTSSIDK